MAFECKFDSFQDIWLQIHIQCIVIIVSAKIICSHFIVLPEK